MTKKKIDYQEELYKIEKKKQQSQNVVGCLTFVVIAPFIILAIYLMV